MRGWCVHLCVACTFMNVDSLEMSTLHRAVRDTSLSDDVSESARSINIFLVLYPDLPVSDLPPPLPRPRPLPRPDIAGVLLLEKKKRDQVLVLARSRFRFRAHALIRLAYCARLRNAPKRARAFSTKASVRGCRLDASRNCRKV